MTVSILSIDRHSNVYQWFFSVGTEIVHSRFGQHNLAACLECAAKKAPKSTGIVEIIYQNIHMGSHKLDEIIANTHDLATHIGDRYSRLTAPASSAV